MLPRPLGILALCLLGALAGCQKLANFKEFSFRSDDEASTCTTQSDCSNGVCVVGYCRPACATDVTCVEGALCISEGTYSGCRLAAELSCTNVGEDCEANSGLRCALDHSCRPPCGRDSDCGVDAQKCLAETCVGGDEPGTKWFDCDTGRSCGGSDGADIISCNETSDGPTVLASCDSPALCEQGRHRGSCAAASCTPGMKRCEASTVEVCDEDGAKFTASFPACASAALCELTRGRADASECTPPACDVGELRCHDGAVGACNDDLTGFDEEPCEGSRGQCDPGTGTCIALAVDAQEVTRADYVAFLGASSKPELPAGCNFKTSHEADATCMARSDVCQGTRTCDDEPQVCVDWCDAWAYCAWRGQRLCGRIGGGAVPFDEFANPAESEWMNACSSGGEYALPYGDTVVNMNCQGAIRANQSGNRSVASGSLAKCRSTAAGYSTLLDLSGNAAEWDDSCDKAAEGTKSGQSDQCHARGGSFLSENKDLTCAAANVVRRDATLPSLGFRCCGAVD